MCGIFGKISYKNKVSIDNVLQMSDSLLHRGPDEEGIWTNFENNVCLGHRRLSIIDLSIKGKQPMTSNCGRYVITFNGEIYNYKELKSYLPNIIFKTETDTEVLLELFAQKGIDCLNLLNGMFAFAIWDNKQNQLVCARDRFGEKPFYYHFNNNELTFASEIKAFWRAGISKKINNGSLFNFLINNRVEDFDNRTSTFYEDIVKLDVGSYLILSEKGIITSKYYKLNYSNEKIAFPDAVTELKRLMFDSVKIRMQSDVEVGSSLSGGLDSSIIVSIINQINNKPLNTFSARFKDFDKDEGKYLDLMVKNPNVISNPIWINKEQFESSFEEVCYYQDEPFSSASINAQFQVMGLAKTLNTTVLLDGQGADEYFAGYFFYLNNYYRTLKKGNVPMYHKELLAYKKKNNEFWNRPYRRKLINEFPEVNQFYNKVRDYFSKNEIKDLFDKDVYHEHISSNLHENSTLKERLHLSLFGGELQELLRYADRNSMAHSREVRLPYLDHRIVEFIMSLPEEYLINNAYSKFILRKTFENDLPKEIIWRRDKIGFEIPQNSWLEGSLDFKNRFPTFKEFDSEVFSKSFNISALSLFL